MIAQVRRFFFDQYTGAIPVWVVGRDAEADVIRLMFFIASAPIIRVMELQILIYLLVGSIPARVVGQKWPRFCKTGRIGYYVARRFARYRNAAKIKDNTHGVG